MLKLRNQYFILRHGQTIYQTKRKKFAYPWPERIPVPLTREGKEQVEMSAKKLIKENIDFIYCSDVYRTRQTSEILRKILKFKKSKIKYDKRLRDISLGICQGKPRAGFYQYFRYSKERFYKKPKNGESWNDLGKRMTNFIKEIDKKHKDKKILIISHGDPLLILEKTLRGLSKDELLRKKQKIFLKTGEFKKLN